MDVSQSPPASEDRSTTQAGVGLPYGDERRTCGFRLSKTDVAVLIAATVVGAVAYQISIGFSLFVPFVVYHFFLFCNVFRIPRKPELVWGAVFVIHTAVWILFSTPNILLLFVVQFVFTILTIRREIQKPTYHGVFSQQLNPQINDYLSGKI